MSSYSPIKKKSFDASEIDLSDDDLGSVPEYHPIERVVKPRIGRLRDRVGVKELAQIDIFNHTVDDQRLCHQTAAGIQTGLHAEHEERRYCHRQVHHKQPDANVHAAVFSQDHRQDIRTAAGCIHIKQHRGSNGRQKDRKDQLQHRLIRHRPAHREKVLHQRQSHR